MSPLALYLDSRSVAQEGRSCAAQDDIAIDTSDLRLGVFAHLLSVILSAELSIRQPASVGY